MTITQFLKTKVPFLEGIPAEQAAELAKKTQQESYKKGQTIIFAGTSVEGLNIIAEGKVSVWIRPAKGKPFEQVAELGPGEVFGETSIVEFKMAGAQIKSAQDGTVIFVIPQTVFRATMDAHPEFKQRILTIIENRQAERHGGEKRKDALTHDEAEKPETPPAGQTAAPAEQPAPAAQPEQPAPAEGDEAQQQQQSQQ